MTLFFWLPPYSTPPTRQQAPTRHSSSLWALSAKGWKSWCRLVHGCQPTGASSSAIHSSSLSLLVRTANDDRPVVVDHTALSRGRSLGESQSGSGYGLVRDHIEPKRIADCMFEPARQYACLMGRHLQSDGNDCHAVRRCLAHQGSMTSGVKVSGASSGASGRIGIVRVRDRHFTVLNPTCLLTTSRQKPTQLVPAWICDRVSVWVWVGKGLLFALCSRQPRDEGLGG